jgi:ABC-type enterochelin transport system substrate-binding protein
MPLLITTTGQKDKASEVEAQAKKAEAAQRRKLQVEKAEREQQVSLVPKSFLVFRLLRSQAY